ncbi:MAG: KOW domain-containing RNA-binding protein [Acetatifactor sp.]|nr:KOW domain-containing RNA-binding protein [Acetatifactor sp.]
MIGQLVTSKAGHDKGTLYVIVSEDEKYICVTDGRLKAPDAPKRKNRKHIQPINRYVNDEIRTLLEAGKPVRPEAIRFAIKQVGTIE